MNDPVKLRLSGDEKEHMHMVRHDAPGKQLITRPVEVFQRFGDKGAVLTKNCGTGAGVEVLIEAVAEGAV